MIEADRRAPRCSGIGGQAIEPTMKKPVASRNAAAGAGEASDV